MTLIFIAPGIETIVTVSDGRATPHKDDPYGVRTDNANKILKVSNSCMLVCAGNASFSSQGQVVLDVGDRLRRRLAQFDDAYGRVLKNSLLTKGFLADRIMSDAPSKNFQCEFLVFEYIEVEDRFEAFRFQMTRVRGQDSVGCERLDLQTKSFQYMLLGSGKRTIVGAGPDYKGLSEKELFIKGSTTELTTMESVLVGLDLIRFASSKTEEVGPTALAMVLNKVDCVNVMKGLHDVNHAIKRVRKDIAKKTSSS